MLLSIFVYTTTFLIMFSYALCLKDNKIATIHNKKIFKRWDILMALVFAIVFGLRYDVGIDYESYKEIYEFQYIDRFEYLFKYITIFLHEAGFHVVFYFGLWAFGQIFFLLKAFKDERFIYPSLIFTLFTGQYFLLWMNVIRQDLAACIFIYSISFIVNKNFVKYLFCIVLAFGLHKTALLLLLFYPIFQIKKEYFSNIYIQLIFLLFSLIVGLKASFILIIIETFFIPFVSTLDYDEVYTVSGVENRMREITVGISFITSLSIDIFIILNSQRMKKFYDNEKINCFYDLYYGGACINLILSSSFLLLRPMRYLRFFKMIISAYLLYYLYANRRRGGNMALFILFLVLHFILYAAIFGSSAEAGHYIYQFIKI